MNKSRPCSLFLIGFALLLSTCPSLSQAVTLTWPTLSGSCSTSLQACIDTATSGDQIVISKRGTQTYHFIDQDISIINKAVELTVANGVDAVFENGRNIYVSVSSDVEVNGNIKINKLVLRRGQIRVDASSRNFRVLNFYIENNRLLDVPSAPAGQNLCGVQVVSAVGASVITERFFIRNNVVFANAASNAQAAICSRSSNTGSITISDNRIYGNDGLSYGISAGLGRLNALEISRNFVVGVAREDQSTGINIDGQLADPGALVNINNNVVSNCSLAIQLDRLEQQADIYIENNTTTFNAFSGIRLLGAATRVTLAVTNNLVAFNGWHGFYIATGAGSILSDANNLDYQNSMGSDWVHSGSVLNADPWLLSQEYPQPQPGSPAISAGTGAGLYNDSSLDVSGEARISGLFIDIGAFEHNEDKAVRITRPSYGILEPVPFVILQEPENYFPSRAVLVTSPVHAASPTQMRQHLGIQYDVVGFWGLIHEGGAAMEPNRTFHVIGVPVYNPALPSGFGLFPSKTRFMHSTSAVDNYSWIDQFALNSKPYALPIAVHRPYESTGWWNHAVGVEYVNIGGLAAGWGVRNESEMVQFNSGTEFHVIVPPVNNDSFDTIGPGPTHLTAFRAAVGSSPAMELRLEHPLLDNNPCAAPVVGRADTPNDMLVVRNQTYYSLEYRPGSGVGAPGHWFVIAEQPMPPALSEEFPAYAAFHVLMDGNQVGKCLVDKLFSNGFE